MLSPRCGSDKHFYATILGTLLTHVTMLPSSVIW